MRLLARFSAPIFISMLAFVSPIDAQNYCPASTLVISAPGVGEEAASTPLGAATWDQNARNVSAICRGETTPRGTTLPSTCGVGQLFFDTDADPGSNLFGCTSTDFWSLLGGGGGDGGGSSTVTITDLRKSSSETLTHDNYSELIWQTEIDDVGGYHAANAAAVVIPVGEGGVFNVQCGGLFAANGTGMRFLDLWLNGTFFARTQNHAPPASNSLGLTVDRTRRFADGDSITCAAYQDSGGDLSLFSAPTSTFFTLVRLGD